MVARGAEGAVGAEYAPSREFRGRWAVRGDGPVSRPAPSDPAVAVTEFFRPIASFPGELHMIWRRFIALLSFMPTFVAAQGNGDRDKVRELDAYFAKAAKDWNVPGLRSEERRVGKEGRAHMEADG